MANYKDVITGAALGTFLGSLAFIFYPQRRQIIKSVLDQTHDLAEKTKEYSDILKGLKQRSVVQQNASHLTSGILGLVLGVGAALLLTPKSGKQLRTHISRAYNTLFDKTQNVVRVFKNNSHPLHTQDTLTKRRAPRPKEKSKSQRSESVSVK